MAQFEGAPGWERGHPARPPACARDGRAPKRQPRSAGPALQNCPGEAAIHLHGCAGEIRSGVGKKERGDARELSGFAVAAEGDGRCNAALMLFDRDARFLAIELVELLQAVGGNPARKDLIYTDFLSGQFISE